MRHKILHPSGIDYPDPKKPGANKHVKEGDVVDDLPETAHEWLLENGDIEAVTDTPAQGEK